MASERTPTANSNSFLPPPEVWRYIPTKSNRIPTPVNEHGLVDVERLMDTAEGLIDPDYSWRLDLKPNIHHLYWEKNRYPNIEGRIVNPRKFREDSINQIVVSREDHAIFHTFMEAPDPPTDEVKRDRREAQYICGKLLMNARQSKALTEARYVPEVKLKRGQEHHLWQFLIEVEEAQKLPVEFYPADVSNLAPTTPEELHALVSFLGNALARANYAKNIQGTNILIPPQDSDARLVA